MCTGIIGHCQCLRCVDHPVTGKLLRVEFCPEKQDELVGIWTRSSPDERKAVPCDDLTFDRVREPAACHYKEIANKTDLNSGSKSGETNNSGETDLKNQDTNKNSDTDLKSKDMNTKFENHAAAATKKGSPATPDSGVGITFTPINATAVANMNAVAIARPALATPAKNIKYVRPYKDTAAAAITISDDEPEINPGPTNNNRYTATDPSTTVTKPITKPPVNKAMPHPTPFPIIPETPKKKTYNATGTGTPHTPGSRTRLPDSRPNTPRVQQATAAARAAEEAHRRATGQWTHAETIKLLLLRVKEVEFEDMGLYLPGRDPASCVDRITGLAVKHGYEDYV